MKQYRDKLKKLYTESFQKRKKIMEEHGDPFDYESSVRSSYLPDEEPGKYLYSHNLEDKVDNVLSDLEADIENESSIGDVHDDDPIGDFHFNLREIRSAMQVAQNNGRRDVYRELQPLYHATLIGTRAKDYAEKKHFGEMISALEMTLSDTAIDFLSGGGRNDTNVINKLSF